MMQNFLWANANTNLLTSKIENILLKTKEIYECIALERYDKNNHAHLILYLVLNNNSVLDYEKLDLLITPLLPPHFLKTIYLEIPQLPLTSSGKVNYKTLLKMIVPDDEVVAYTLEKISEIDNTIKEIRAVFELEKFEQSILFVPDFLGINIENSNETSADTVNSHIIRPLNINSSNPTQKVSLAYSDGGALEIPENAPKTLTHALLDSARNSKGSLVLYDSDDKKITQTYSELLEKALKILTGLNGLGLKSGDVVILQIHSLGDYFSIFWGCVLGGIRPITVTVPSSYDGNNNTVQKLINIWELLEHPTIIASHSLVSLIKNIDRLKKGSCVSIKQLLQNPGSNNIVHPSPDDVLFYQLTSGSTGVPKCIQITHKGVIAHIHATAKNNNYLFTDVSLNWLPFDHVVPILSYHLKDLYLGSTQIHLSPKLILANPLLWLNLIEQYKVTHTWSPNFWYKLIVDCIKNHPDASYNLSSIKYFMNAGEQVTLGVVEDFLAVLEPFGISDDTMQPAFGMAEVCTCMTYNNEFNTNTGFFRALKSSLNDHLINTVEKNSNSIDFIDLGKPIPGVQIRITNKANQVVSENVIGRLQIKGDVTTPGYLNNPNANKEAFVGEGWFNSGDLGFINKGKLFLTGREKEIVIINGVNYPCYEIEEIVNNINGVLPTFVAACSVTNSKVSESEELAIFFVTKIKELKRIVRIIQLILEGISSNTGIKPSYIIPVDKSLFPKTTSGKIQRTKLKTLFENGHFDALVSMISMYTKDGDTIPGFYYKPVWQRTPPPGKLQETTAGVTLIFADTEGLWKEVCKGYDSNNHLYILVHASNEYKRIDSRSYQIHPDLVEDYTWLIRSIKIENNIGKIIYLWDYNKNYCDLLSMESITKTLDTGIHALLLLTKALNLETEKHNTQITLFIVSLYSQYILPSDKFNAVKASLFGFIKSIVQEFPDLVCRHLDLEDSNISNASIILNEIEHQSNDIEVAYRGSNRYVHKIMHIKPKPLIKSPLKFGGTYLIAGGLGGIGVKLSEYLLRKYKAKLILLGRTPLPDDLEVSLSQKQVQVKHAYNSLKAISKDIVYKNIDICDSSKLLPLANTVDHLDGIFHLAGAIDDNLIVNETLSNLGRLLYPKILGTHILHLLQQNYKNCFIVNFASVNGYFGAYSAASYSAANSFQSSYSRYLASNNSYNFSWSMWNEIGMSSNPALKEFVETKGYYLIEAHEGLCALDVALTLGEKTLIIGLNKSKPLIKKHLVPDTINNKSLSLYFQSANHLKALKKISRLKIKDAFGNPVKINLHSMNDPVAAIDSGSLVRENFKGAGLESSLIDIWKKVLRIQKVTINDSFFSLGGDSITAVQLISTINSCFKINLSLHDIIKNPAILNMSLLVHDKVNKKSQFIDETQLNKKNVIDDHKIVEFPLTDIQRAYLVGRSINFNLGGVSTHYYTEIDCENLNLNKFTEVLNSLIKQHDVLRTIILMTGKQKVLSEPFHYKVNIKDLRSIPDSQSSNLLLQLRNKLSTQILPLDTCPLFDIRATLITNNSTRLHFYFDLLILDFSSILQLFNQIALLYGNADYKLKPANFSFKEYMLSIKNHVNKALVQKSREYWDSRIETLSPCPSFQIVSNIASISGASFTRRRFSLPINRWSDIKEICSTIGITPSVAIITAFAEIISRWSKNKNFTLNMPMFNRQNIHNDVKDLLGTFTTNIFLEINNSDLATFEYRAIQIQNNLWEAMEHSYISGVKVLEDQGSRLDGTLNIMPIVFTSLIGLSSLGLDNSVFSKLGKEVYSISRTPQVYFDHMLIENDSELIIIWDTIDELFVPGALNEMFDAYEYLLNLLCDYLNWSKTQPYLKLQSEKNSLHNISSRSIPKENTLLHSLFLNQVDRQNDKFAIITPDKQISYKELYNIALKIASWLRENGAKPGTLVGVVLDKGWEQVAAVLGVLMAGAAYTPISPNLPTNRSKYIFGNCSIQLIISIKACDLSVSWPENSRHLYLDNIEALTATMSIEQCIQTPSDLAYVIFTSGSTGVPKGVMITHDNAVNTILDVNKRFDINEFDSVFFLSELNFDLSVYDIFGLLGAGGTIVIPDLEKSKEPDHWYDMLSKHKITIWNSVPALMELLIDYCTSIKNIMPCQLRLVLLSGDWISLDLPDKIKKLWSECICVSLGGATEASIWSIFHVIDRIQSSWKSIPYGRSLSNQYILILDDFLRDCPEMVPGEIYIGGDGVALGYWNDPERTRAQFIIHPESNERMYKTGDCGQYLSNGAIEFLGRKDNQVKLNGYRIELGEIESILNLHPTIQQSFVKIEKNCANLDTLIACIIPKTNSRIDKEVLQSFLFSNLPRYMVPSIYKEAKFIFLTPNGKIDRNKIFESAVEILETEPEMMLSDPIEELIHDVFKKTMKIKFLNPESNFFDLGADSLTIIKIYNEFKNSAPHITIQVIDFFHFSSIRTLAKKISSNNTLPNVPDDLQSEIERRRQLKPRRNNKLKALIDAAN